MSFRAAIGVLASVALLSGGASVSWAQGGAAPVVQRVYTVFVELQPPYMSNRAALKKMLKADGYESFPEGERELALVLTEAQIGKLFQASVRMRKVEAGAAVGVREVPYLEGARIPHRFEKLMQRAYFDPQR